MKNKLVKWWKGLDYWKKLGIIELLVFGVGYEIQT